MTILFTMYLLHFTQTHNFRLLQFLYYSFRTQQSHSLLSRPDDLKLSRHKNFKPSLSLTCKLDTRLGQVDSSHLAKFISGLHAQYQARLDRVFQISVFKVEIKSERPRFNGSSKLGFTLSVSSHIKNCNYKQLGKFYENVKLKFSSIKLLLGRYNSIFQ